VALNFKGAFYWIFQKIVLLFDRILMKFPLSMASGRGLGLLQFSVLEAECFKII
jgi:hypothetical protein